MKNSLVVSGILIFILTCLIPSLSFSESDPTNFYLDNLYIEKAKQQIITKDSGVNINDLEFLKDQSGSMGNHWCLNNSKYYAGYFIFLLTSSVKSVAVEDLVIKHFDAYEVGIFEDGNFLSEGGGVKKIHASSCKTGVELTDPGFSVSYHYSQAKDIVAVLCDFKKQVLESYQGQNVQINCFTENDISNHQVILFLENVLAHNKISLIEQSQNTIKAFHTNSHNPAAAPDAAKSAPRP